MFRSNKFNLRLYLNTYKHKKCNYHKIWKNDKQIQCLLLMTYLCHEAASVEVPYNSMKVKQIYWCLKTLNPRLNLNDDDDEGMYVRSLYLACAAKFTGETKNKHIVYFIIYHELLIKRTPAYGIPGEPAPRAVRYIHTNGPLSTRSSSCTGCI